MMYNIGVFAHKNEFFALTKFKNKEEK